jgi:hypothetical protein
VLLAELEVRHSRAVAPTRRVALGDLWLPADPAPGFGGILLAGVVAAKMTELDEDLKDGLDLLIDDLHRGRRIAQPRLRHRFQTDVVGLERSKHRLIGEGEELQLELDDHASPLPQALGAVYAAGKLSYRARPAVFRLLRRATRWGGANDDRLIGYLTGDEAAQPWRERELDEGWALTILGFKMGSEPSRSDIVKRFRRMIRDAHPDHGAAVEGAGLRVTELAAAKRILLTEE